MKYIKDRDIFVDNQVNTGKNYILNNYYVGKKKRGQYLIAIYKRATNSVQKYK